MDHQRRRDPGGCGDLAHCHIAVPLLREEIHRRDADQRRRRQILPDWTYV
jgi:hypothetical protein